MNPLVWIPLMTQLALPLLLLGWLAWRRERSRSAWLLEAVFVASYIVAIALAGLWLILPWYLPWLYGLLFVVALVRGRPRGSMWPASRRDWLGLAARGAAALIAVVVVLVALAGHRVPPDPYRAGEFVAVKLTPSASATSAPASHPARRRPPRPAHP